MPRIAPGHLPGPDDSRSPAGSGSSTVPAIDGTDETGSIGHAVSHSSARMTIADVIDLYDQVSVDTPV